MEKIQPGKHVELTFDLYRILPAADGATEEQLVHQVTEDSPESFVYGVTQGMIRPLEAAIEGLEPGGEFDVRVAAADAFGMPDPEAIACLPKDVFMIDGKFDSERVTPGAALPMMTAEGFRITGIVKEVTPDEVVMDFNHPLAGDDIHIIGKILSVREATPEEIHPAGGCCCGSGGCSDGGCSDGNCSDGTCSDGSGSCGCSGCGN